MSSTRARRLAAAGPERGTVLLVSVLLGFESVLYSVVTPVLPHYAHQFAVSKPGIGLLAAAYPAGMVPGSLLGGWIATRAGVRRTTVLGLLVFDVSIVAFGFGANIAVLDGLRFVQGMACGLIWSGGLTWVIAVAPRARRGEILGSVLASAIFGTLLGPVVGTFAVAAGTGVVFSVVGAISIALTVWTLRHPEPPRAALGAGAPLRALVSSPRALLGFWLILIVACTMGATSVLLPLRLSRFGASGVAIGVTFVLAALLSTCLAPWIGRVLDRRGMALPLVAGLSATAVLLAALPLPAAPLPLAALTVMTLGGPLTGATMAAFSLMTLAAEGIGAALAFATMLLNLAWALGEMIGAPAAAGLSLATSDTVPLVVLAVLMLLTLGPVLTLRPLGGSAPPVTVPAEHVSSERSTLAPASVGSARRTSGGT